MRWQVAHPKKTSIVEIPDYIPSEQNLNVRMNDQDVTIRWLPKLNALCVIDPKTGVEKLYKARLATFQRFQGESEVKAHIEFVGGESTNSQLYGATLQRYVPGQDARAKAAGASGSNIRSPMAGKILKVLVQNGDKVEAGQPLLVIEAMKMENKVFAPVAGTVSGLKAKELAQVTPGQQLLAIT